MSMFTSINFVCNRMRFTTTLQLDMQILFCVTNTFELVLKYAVKGGYNEKTP